MGSRLATALKNIDLMMPTADLDDLPVSVDKENSDSTVVRLRLSDIEMSDRVRKSYDEELIQSFEQTFREHGWRGVLWVREKKPGTYHLIAGGTRYLGAERVQIEWVDAQIFDVNDSEALDLELEENLKRRDFNDLETVHGILRSLELELSLSREQIVTLFSWSSRNRQPDGTHLAPRKDSSLNTIPLEQLEFCWSIVEKKFIKLGRYSPEGFRVNFLPLLKLPESVQEVIMHGKLEGSKARILARISDQEERDALIEKVIAEDWSRGQISDFVQDWREKHDPKLLKNAEGHQFSSRVKSILQRIERASLQGRKRTKAEKLLRDLESLLDSVETD
jgi:ParB family transcriptional regulator, chromosome partitioning protein